MPRGRTDGQAEKITMISGGQRQRGRERERERAEMEPFLHSLASSITVVLFFSIQI